MINIYKAVFSYVRNGRQRTGIVLVAANHYDKAAAMIEAKIVRDYNLTDSGEYPTIGTGPNQVRIASIDCISEELRRAATLYYDNRQSVEALPENPAPATVLTADELALRPQARRSDGQGYGTITQLNEIARERQASEANARIAAEHEYFRTLAEQENDG